MAYYKIIYVSLMLALTSANNPIALGAENKTELFKYVDSKKIALDPVLLKSEDVSDFDFSKYESPEITELNNKLSALEKAYSDRAKENLYQFGYDSIPRSPAKNQTAGAAQEDYILERGDELSITIRGDQNLNTTTTITNDGQLIIADLIPITAAGRSIKDVQSEIKSVLSNTYNKEVFLSLNKIRQINIIITGNVSYPGQVSLSTFNTVIDALAAAGGVEKTGTLRQIKLIRNNQSTIIDLYGVLIYGSSISDLTLRDGDKIVVGTIGPTLAIAGAVKRAGIYEILPAGRSLFINPDDNSQKLSRDDLLTLSGGALLPANTRYLRFDLNGNDADTISDVPNGMLRIFSDGDILYVGQAKQAHRNDENNISGGIEVKGAFASTGYFALAETPSISYLLRSKSNLTKDTYPLIGIIERWNTTQMATEIIPFSPQQIISGGKDIKLREADKITFFSKHDIKQIHAPIGEDNNNLINNDEKEAKENSVFSVDIKNFLIEHSVFLRGSIGNSGAYPITNDTSLESLLYTAGGASFEKNINNIEITQPLADKQNKRTNINLDSTPPNLITLRPGDTIRINQKFKKLEDRHVLLVGEVKNAGAYDLVAGDTLSSLIARAGGLTDEAYPKGAIFSRKSERIREEARYKNEAKALELQLATAMGQNDKKPNIEEINLARDLITQLKGSEALGRITVEADPSILSTSPELDILLESGDKIYIPKRPLTVRVAGEVLSPAALQFRTGKSPSDYINESGGFTYNADSDRAFVVYPNGSAQPLSVSAWNQSSIMIPPGSTIIVPRDPKPLTFMDSAKDLTQILANLATTAIFAEDLRDKN